VSVFSLILVGIMVCGTARAGDVDIYGVASSFTWEEFNDNGSRLLKESGTFYGIGCAYWWKSQGHVTSSREPRFFVRDRIVGYCELHSKRTSAGRSLFFSKFIVNGREEDVEWVFLDIDANEFRMYLYEF
jgi:hypothetical protein